MHSTSAAPGSQPQFARRPACQPARSRRGTRDAAPRQGRTEGKGYTRSSPPSPGFQSGLRYLHARGGGNASSHGRLPARLRGLPPPHGTLFSSPPPLPLLPLPPPRLTRCWSPAACRPPCRSPCVLESSRRGLQQGRKGRASVRPSPAQRSSQVGSGSRAGKVPAEVPGSSTALRADSRLAARRPPAFHCSLMACDCRLSSGMRTDSMTRSVESCCSCAHSGARACSRAVGQRNSLGAQRRSSLRQQPVRHAHSRPAGVHPAGAAPRQAPTCVSAISSTPTHPPPRPTRPAQPGRLETFGAPTCVSAISSSASHTCAFSSSPVAPPCTRCVQFCRWQRRGRYRMGQGC